MRKLEYRALAPQRFGRSNICHIQLEDLGQFWTHPQVYYDIFRQFE